MLGHMIGQIKPKTASTANDVVDRSISPDHCREQILGSISELHALSRRGLWGMLLFMSLSAITLYCSEAGIFALVPADIKEMFGDPPPAHLLHIVLAVSWLSAFVLIMGRVAGDGRPTYNWCNIGLPTVFYPLYIFSDPAGTHFPAVFAAGLILLIVEHASVTFYASRAIREETARLNHLQN
ncbi:MAG: hypothetical protein A2075_24410 [Geobacteraceae bacterium GWC2_58_44]|nr:MAG: hypothetical protein A2075_24410 [Geobacteraceae bacterium GWC2_58_44]HBG07921.1 hypothetical protein [Geobacter sp.]